MRVPSGDQRGWLAYPLSEDSFATVCEAASTIQRSFRSFRGVHGRGDVSLPQFIDSVVCVGSYRRGDAPWDIIYTLFGD